MEVRPGSHVLWQIALLYRHCLKFKLINCVPLSDATTRGKTNVVNKCASFLVHQSEVVLLVWNPSSSHFEKAEETYTSLVSNLPAYKLFSSSSPATFSTSASALSYCCQYERRAYIF